MTDLACNNAPDCPNVYPGQGRMSQTETSARVHGWRVWTSGGLDLILCPACVGQRARRDKAPGRLEGEQPLF